MSRYVEIVEIGFRNFFRYGSNWTIFKFENGLSNIYGENGVGKSSIVEILHYALFGSSYRGVNLSQLINKKNGSNLETYVIVNVTDDSETNKYYIKRGLEPKIEEIYKNNKTKPEKIDQQFNKYIVNKILGFDANINEKIISVHAKNGSFITMKLDERRQVIDSIINLTKTKDYQKVAKTLLSESSTKKDILAKDIEYTKKAIDPLQKIIDDNAEDKNIKIERIDQDIVRATHTRDENSLLIINLNKEHSVKTLEINELIDSEKTAQQAYMLLDPSSLNSEYMKINSELMYLKNKANDIKKEIAKIVPNTTCNSCGNSYSEDQAKNKIAEKNEEFKKIADEGKRTKKSLDSVLEKINNAKLEADKVKQISEKISELRFTLSTIQHKILIADQNYRMSNDIISKLNSERDELIAKSDLDSSIIDRVKSLNEELDGFNTQMKELHEEIDCLKYIVGMFSDEGIKALVLKKFLPIMNKLINYYLRVFNLNLKFEITSDYGYEMTTNDALADSFTGLSGGQQTRINLAILFAQTDLIKLIGNFKTNILFLDELIDTGLDDKGLSDTIKILNEIGHRDNKSITFISHKIKDNIIDNVDRFYHAKAIDDSFSEILEVDKTDVLNFIHNR